MSDPKSEIIDLAIIGGGLSGCLLLMALRSKQPNLKIGLFEKNIEICGNHTWCLHDQDLPTPARTWLQPLISKSWQGYEVHFPKYSRILNGTYHAIKSEDLREKVKTTAASLVFENHELVDIEKIHQDEIILHFKNQAPQKTKSIILCQGWQTSLNPKQLGWQKFVGLELKLKSPHGLQRPILKDVLQKQNDGYRFIYTLPFSNDSLLIEDTYYSNSKELNLDEIRQGILQYAESKGWLIDNILRAEVGQLPLFLDLPSKTDSPWPTLGAGSQFVNPVTGYTLPMTLQMIEALVQNVDLSGSAIKSTLLEVENSFRSRLHYLTWLNRMMFLAAEPHRRYEILERFYQLSEGLIGRFYSAQLTWKDRARILIGKPPVPVMKAIKALTVNLNT